MWMTRLKYIPVNFTSSVFPDRSPRRGQKGENVRSSFTNLNSKFSAFAQEHPTPAASTNTEDQ